MDLRVVLASVVMDNMGLGTSVFSPPLRGHFSTYSFTVVVQMVEFAKEQTTA